MYTQNLKNDIIFITNWRDKRYFDPRPQKLGPWFALTTCHYREQYM